ncbi:MAG: hypothetical protein K6F99_03850 [Lachnospiraceae bacterium]|nr:hypothetical protein [Lachnospiraceae bacterium]
MQISSLQTNRYQNISQQQTNKLQQKLSSGYKINSAADGAADLAIAQKQVEEMNRQLDMADNEKSEQLMSNVADGAYSGMSDIMMDMYSNSIRAESSLLSESDRQAIYDNMSALQEGLNSLASNTTFNETKVVDDELIENVNSQIDSGSIDKAMDALNSERSKNGAKANGLEHSINARLIAAENMASANSRTMDTEYGSVTSAYKTNQTLNTYQNMMQKQSSDNQSAFISGMLQV